MGAVICQANCQCGRHSRGPNPSTSQRNRERIWTQESKDKLSDSKKGKKNPFVSEANKRRKWTQEQRKHHSKVLSVVPHSPEWNAKVSKGLINFYENNPGTLNRRIKNKGTSLEKILYEHLCSFINSKELFVSYQIGRFLIDVAHPAHKVACEADGEYWHNRPGAKEHDAERDAYLFEKGWLVVRFPESWLMERKKTLTIASSPLVWE